MNHINKTLAFTLLEIIIVIIIIGVLVASALPKMFSMIEKARAAEAIAAIGTIRVSMERAYLMQGTYQTISLDDLEIDDPTTSPNSHFAYVIGPYGKDSYSIIAYRNTLDGGDNYDSMIMFVYTMSTARGEPGHPFFCGSDRFSSVGIGRCPPWYINFHDLP
jgi:prepilin-type N-terminal cleavage/methylation domain-containing protein